MDFKNILEENNSKRVVAVGYDEKTGEIKYLDLFNDSSIVVTGETGSGKSILLDQIVCQLIKNNTSLDMEFYLIDPSGVELNLYADSRYSKEYAMRDSVKAQEIFYKVRDEADRRSRLLIEENCPTIDDYNRKYPEDKLSDIVLVIDDNDDFVLSEDFAKQMGHLITNTGSTGVFVIAAFSNTDNYYFKSDKNLLPHILITFDMSDAEHASFVNFPGAENLGIGDFMLREGRENKYKVFKNFEFEDKIIVDTLNK